MEIRKVSSGKPLQSPSKYGFDAGNDYGEAKEKIDLLTEYHQRNQNTSMTKTTYKGEGHQKSLSYFGTSSDTKS